MDATRHRLLRLADLRQLKRLFFTSRRRVSGQHTGRHRSHLRGRSVEFNDYRQYTPGDALGDVDWKAFGRSDRLFVRMSELQSDAAVNVLVDASASMAYAGVDGRETSKYEHAARLAAAIVFLVTRQGDRAGLGVAQDGLMSFVSASRSRRQLPAALDALERPALTGPASLAATLKAFTRRIQARGLLVVVSDLLEEPGPIFAAIGAYRARGGDAVVFHVLHADELKLPGTGGTVWVDSESDDRVSSDADEIRADYDRRLREWLDLWKTGCRSRGIDYNLAPTTLPCHRVLERYLVSRR